MCLNIFLTTFSKYCTLLCGTGMKRFLLGFFLTLVTAKMFEWMSMFTKLLVLFFSRYFIKGPYGAVTKG